MPRQGDGSSDNGPFEEATHNVAHGVTNEDVRHVTCHFFPLPQILNSSSMYQINLIQSILTIVQKSKDKTAPLPEGLHEKGAGLQDANASGGQSQGIKQGPNVGQGGRSN